MIHPCPICKKTRLESADVEPTLPAARCPSCRGVWITSANYFGYLARRENSAPPSVPPSNETHAAEAPPDSPSLKLCPACGKFMHYYPVGHDISFGIDKCNTCGGVWLNDGEWTALVERSLHLKLHAISSDVWQESVRREERAAAERAALLRRLGAEDLSELERVTSWIKGHPQRDVLFSRLQEMLRAS